MEMELDLDRMRFAGVSDSYYDDGVELHFETDQDDDVRIYMSKEVAERMCRQLWAWLDSDWEDDDTPAEEED